MDADGSSFYYQRDGLGSVVNLTSATGVPQWTYGYEPYGSPRTQSQDQPGAPDNPVRYTDQQLDPTGLYHLRARQYDPPTGASSPSTPSHRRSRIRTWPPTCTPTTAPPP